MNDQAPKPPEKPAEQKPAEQKPVEQKRATSSKRYAAYDESHQRFLGGVYETAAEVKALIKKDGPSGHKLVVREV